MRAMPSTEAQRTLVKSPPELWAEFSDPSSLARHLGEFGEIRIVRVEPEKSVEWEAPDATGAVQLKPSGWGTRVTLTVVRESPEPEAVLGPEPEPEAAPEPAPEPEASSAPDPVAEESPEPQPTTRRSRLFARLFRRRAGARTSSSSSPRSSRPSRRSPSRRPRCRAAPEPRGRTRRGAGADRGGDGRAGRGAAYCRARPSRRGAPPAVLARLRSSPTPHEPAPAHDAASQHVKKTCAYAGALEPRRLWRG